MRPSFSPLWLALLPVMGTAQPDSLDDRDKVAYINKSYYALYSASLPDALEKTRWAAETAGREGWTKEEARAQMAWGVVTYLGGDYPNVLPKYLRSLELFESLNDPTGIAAVCNEMAVFYSKQNDMTNCFRYLDRAEKLARDNNDAERLGTNLGIRGAILRKHGKMDEATPYYREVYEIRKKTGDSVGLGYVLLDMGEIAAHAGNLPEAINFVDQSVRIRERIRDISGLAESEVTKGEIYERFGRDQEALRAFEQGLRSADSVGYTDLAHFIHLKIANVRERQGDYKEALAHFRQYDMLKDSLLSKEKVRAIQEVQTRYETAKKELLLAEQEMKLNQTRYLIALLSVLIILIVVVVWIWRRRIQADHARTLQEQLTSAVIDLQEKERARFARDLHDGLGQLISSVRMQLNRSQESWTSQAVGLLDQMHQEIRNIAFALLPHTLVSQGLGPALRELASRLSGPAQLNIHVDTAEAEGRLDARAEVSMYRVCQEWISNVIKYAGAQTLHITLLIQSDGSASLTLEDDGTGFEPANLEQGQGNGWRNIQSRVRLHQGTAYVDSLTGRRGTTLVIELPAVSFRQQNVA